MRFVLQHPRRSARRCSRIDKQRPQRFPPSSSTAATSTPRWSQMDEGRRRDVLQRPDLVEVLPRRHPAGARAPRARGIARCSSPGALRLRSSRALRTAVRRDRRGRDERAPRRHATTARCAGAAHGRDPRPDPRTTTAGRRGSQARGEPSPTPTRRATSRCSSAVGFPVAVNPETRLAAIARKRGWLVEDWSKATGAAESPRCCRSATLMSRARTAPGASREGSLEVARTSGRSPHGGWGIGPPQVGPGGRAQRGPSMGVAGSPHPSPVWGSLSPRRWRRRRRCAWDRWSYVERRPAGTARPGWHRVRTRLAGICGSDLATDRGPMRPRYFDDWVSFPFVPGHEVVGDLDDGTSSGARTGARSRERAASRRRSRAPPPVDGNDYAHLATGHLEPGIQSGFCDSTGGGWAPELVAHDSQLHEPCPTTMSDEQPPSSSSRLAGGIHAALLTLPDARRRQRRHRSSRRARRRHDGPVAADRRPARADVPNARIVVGARYPHQQAWLAKALGADRSCGTPDELARAVRRITGCHVDRVTTCRAGCPRVDRLRSAARRLRRVTACASPVPAARVVMMGMPATGERSTSPACGTVRPSSSAPTRTAPSTMRRRLPVGARSTWRSPRPRQLEISSGWLVGHLSPHRPRRRHRARGRRRPRAAP